MPVLDDDLEAQEFDPTVYQAAGPLPTPVAPGGANPFGIGVMPPPQAPGAMLPLPAGRPVYPGGSFDPISAVRLPAANYPVNPNPSGASDESAQVAADRLRGAGRPVVRDAFGRPVQTQWGMLYPGATSSEAPFATPSAAPNPTQGSPSYDTGPTSGASASTEGGIHAEGYPQAGARPGYPAIGGGGSSPAGGAAAGAGASGEMAARVAGWQDLQQRAKSDPNLAMMLFYLGAQIIQPRYGGQTLLGRIGEAGVNALNWRNASNQMQAEAQAAQQRQALEERKVGAEERRTGASVENLRAQTREMEEKLQYLPQNERDKHNQALVDYHAALQRGDLEGAQALLTQAKAQLESDPAYQKAVINNLNAQSSHFRMMAQNLRIPTIVQEHDRLMQAFLRPGSKWRTDITNPQEREAQADLEAWNHLVPGGAKAMATGLSAEQLMDAASAAYDEAVARKDPSTKQVSPAEWQQRWISTTTMMTGGNAAATQAMAGVSGAQGARAPGAGPGLAAPPTSARPQGVPANAQIGTVQGKSGRYYIWPDPKDSSKVLIYPYQGP